MFWESVCMAALSGIMCLAGNGLSVLLYEGYEWLGDYVLYSLIGLPKTNETQMFIWLLTSLTGIIDFVLAIFWLFPIIASLILRLVLYFNVVLIPEGENSETDYVKGFGDGLGKLFWTVCELAFTAVYPFVLFFLKTRADERIEIAETAVFFVAFVLSKIILIISFFIYTFMFVLILTYMFKSINIILGFVSALALVVFLFYSMYTYGSEHASTYGAGTGIISYWWKFLDGFIEKNTMPWSNVVKSYIPFLR